MAKFTWSLNCWKTKESATKRTKNRTSMRKVSANASLLHFKRAGINPIMVVRRNIRKKKLQKAKTKKYIKLKILQSPVSTAVRNL